MFAERFGSEYIADRLLDLLQASNLLAQDHQELADRIAFFAGEIAGCDPGIMKCFAERAQEGTRGEQEDPEYL